ncbi:MAG: rSAM/selenodomain-associated transferase 1 [Litorivivens sp.]|jgi:rSAM/selenodomain-associated transferase 1
MSDSQNGSSLIIMAKPPIAGKVKTRLARGIGDENALVVYRNLLQHTMDVAQTSALKPEVFATEKSTYFDETGFDQHLQSEGDLGDKMDLACRQMLKSAQKVVIIGTDCPDISHKHIDEANNLLDSHDVVFGPCEDGGYYLLGLKIAHKELFENLPWSTESLLKLTLKRCLDAGISTVLLEELSDVDTIDDLKKSSLWQMFQHVV